MKPIIIAGPCVIESQGCLNEVAEELVRLNKKYDLDIIFKSSFFRIYVIAHPEAVEQILRGVVTEFFLAAVHCRDLDYNRKVAPGFYRYRHRGNIKP